MDQMKLQDLKAKSPTDLISFAEELNVENASTLRKQELMFAILKQLADNDVEIIGQGVVEVLQDGFAFLRSPSANYLPGPDDIYISPLRNCGSFPCVLGIQLKDLSEAQRKGSAILRC